jgi:hypothetical protein
MRFEGGFSCSSYHVIRSAIIILSCTGVGVEFEIIHAS